MILKIIYFFILITNISGFFKIPFKIFKNKEIEKNINYKLPIYHQKIINKINGFYGVIGPDVNISKVNNLYDLFIGDGNIQGLFFNNGNITFVRHYVKTDKLLYEKKYGIIPNNKIVKLLFAILNKLGMMPNILGLANTAFLNVNNTIYALYERDKPYKIDIDIKNKKINTIKKINSLKNEHFSAHSKYNETIETIDYLISENKIDYYQLDNNFKKINSTSINMNYLPIVHDFLIMKDKILITDAPLFFDISKIFLKPLPIYLNKNKNTIIHILNKNNFSIESYFTNNSFYLFHYADYKENDKEIQIYAPLYDEVDFSAMNITGKYRKIIINKKTKLVNIIKNTNLEKLDLDFPIKYDNKILFRNSENKINNGFIICKGLRIIKKLTYKNRTICGEPAIINIDNIPYLISFANNISNECNTFIMIVNLKSYKTIEIPLNISLNIGFHSIFI